MRITSIDFTWVRSESKQIKIGPLLCFMPSLKWMMISSCCSCCGQNPYPYVCHGVGYCFHDPCLYLFLTFPSFFVPDPCLCLCLYSCVASPFSFDLLSSIFSFRDCEPVFLVTWSVICADSGVILTDENVPSPDGNVPMLLRGSNFPSNDDADFLVTWSVICVDNEVILTDGSDENVPSPDGNVPVHRRGWDPPGNDDADFLVTWSVICADSEVILTDDAGENVPSPDGNVPVHRRSWNLPGNDDVNIVDDPQQALDHNPYACALDDGHGVEDSILHHKEA